MSKQAGSQVGKVPLMAFDALTDLLRLLLPF